MTAESLRSETLLAWANRCLREDVPLDVLAAALPYDGAGDDEALAVIDHLADAGWLIVPTPTTLPNVITTNYGARGTPVHWDPITAPDSGSYQEDDL